MLEPQPLWWCNKGKIVLVEPQVADGGRSVPCNAMIVVAEVVIHLNLIMENECAR